MKQFACILFLVLDSFCFPQCEDSDFLALNPIIDNPYFKEHVLTKRTIPYEFVREADVIWSKRVWREIDLREKINHPLYYPFDYHTPSGQYVRSNSHWSLWTILRHHIVKGELTLFSPYNPYQFDMFDGDQFKYPIRPVPGGNYCNDSVFRDQISYYLGKLGPDPTIPLSTVYGEDSIQIIAGVSQFVYPPRDTVWIDSKDIVKYRLKEDWFFDKERSVMDVRIVGIAPIVYREEGIEGTTQITGLEPKFWVYFPHLRYFLTNYYTYNSKNDAQWMSFDDLFWKRRFSSIVIKESTVFDRSIDEYRRGLDALYESDEVLEEVRNFEHNVWDF